MFYIHVDECNQFPLGQHRFKGGGSKAFGKDVMQLVTTASLAQEYPNIICQRLYVHLTSVYSENVNVLRWHFCK